MRRFIAGSFLCLTALLCDAASTEFKLFHIQTDENDKASLQRGAKYFMNYCSGCHSLRYMRYATLGEGLDLYNEDGELDLPLLVNNLMFIKTNILQPIKTNMPTESAKQWFGLVPPDLSLEARARGADWVYTYLKSFYHDETRTFGANNLLKPEVAMPNVFAPLQGDVRLNFPLKHPSSRDINAVLILKTPGEMTPLQFDQMIYDIVNFLNFVSEPMAPVRKRLGLGVLLYLAIFGAVVYALKRQYWKDIYKNTQNSTH